MENGVDLRECIVKLYKEYYHGGLMKLVVIGGGKILWVYDVFRSNSWKTFLHSNWLLSAV